MSAAHWLITHDFVSALSGGGDLPQFNPQAGGVRALAASPSKEVSIWGPRNATKPDPKNLPLDFIIADDDGNVYYRGLADEQAEFQPLDMYAGPNDGATMIAYRRSGKWEVL